MTKSTELLHSYGYALVLSLMFQLTAWGKCFVDGSMYGPAELSAGLVFNWRVWFASCAVYWLGFLAVFLTRRQSPSIWRVVYTGLAFPALFTAAALLSPRFYGAN